MSPLPFFLLLLVVFTISLPFSTSNFTTPLTCSEPNRICTAFLAFRTTTTTNVSVLSSMFDATAADDITADGTSDPGYVYIRKNCSCLASRTYLSNTTYTIRNTNFSSNATAADVAAGAYSGLAMRPLRGGAQLQRAARAGEVVALHLLCGCSTGPWNYLMSYVVVEGDTVETLSSRFGASMDAIEAANGLAGPGPLVSGLVYYIPLDNVPGQPYVVMPPTPAPAPVSTLNAPLVVPKHHSSKFPYGWVIGSMGVVLVLIAAALLSILLYKSFHSRFQDPKNKSKEPDQPVLHKFHFLRSDSFCYVSGRYFCCQFGSGNATRGDVSDHHINIPRGMVVEAIDMEKPVVFTHQEILSSTASFSDSNLLGHGMYGSVYYGVLREQEVAIKRMTATKPKEFLVEMKVLCKVHHASLVELIGYAASKDDLFLVYEYAQKGSLKNHLHEPQSKGHTSLSWISRVQIAVDAARGLEYIHEHTKDHYVHRDIKTSNILLDGSFRAKISDFGLAKLVVRSGDGEASVTKVVGTFGYLAPEYLRDGLATTKSDVYAFGVVLFELISGKEAITRADGTVATTNSQRRSLASVMLNALRSCPNSMCMANLKVCVDPNLMDLYPHDCVYKMAMLAKQCVDEDPILRPDMKQVVISLSQILLSSIEWEATLAGNSQIFSDLVAGR